MVEVGNKKMKEKVQGLVFQIQEYSFVEVQEGGSSDNYKSRSDLYARYGQDKIFSLEKYLKFYSKVRDISDKDISLFIVKDHVKNTLNLAGATENRFLEMRLNLQKIPVPSKIHLHKKTGEVIDTELMKSTLMVQSYNLQFQGWKVN